MKILCCTSCVPMKYNGKIKNLSTATNQYQNNFIKALRNKGHEIKIISFASYPLDDNYSDIYNYFKKQGDFFFSKEKDGFYKSAIIFRKELKQQLKWADCVIAYNFVYAWLGVGKMAKRRGLKSTLIFADYAPPKGETSFAKKILASITERDIKSYSKVVFLSQLSNHYATEKQETEIIPGGLNFSEFFDLNQKTNKKTIVLFSGAHLSSTGVGLLLQSIEKIKDKNFEFVFTGKGELVELVKKAMKQDKRIVFKGFLNREEYLRELNNASVLVNPRDMSALCNQNNFPSKVIEYLASGTPIVSTRFSGWQNFKQVIDFCESNADSLADKIVEIAKKINKEYNEKVFQRNREFVKQFEWEHIVERYL